MAVLRNIFKFLHLEMTEPTVFGWYHILSLLIVIGLTVFLCIKFKNCSEKVFKRIVLISWLAMVILEIYKQIVFSSNIDGNTITWDYQWYAFPFQFCSMSIYVLPFLVFVKNKAVNRAVMSFMATFSLFAGMAVMLYPSTVYIDTIGVNIQTMVHHGLQVILGIFFIVYNRKNMTWKDFFGGCLVYLIVLGVALLLNFIVPLMVTETFNMFYISPYFPSDVPVVQQLHSLLAENMYPVFLILYYLGFNLIALIYFLATKGILAICRREKKRVV